MRLQETNFELRERERERLGPQLQTDGQPTGALSSGMGMGEFIQKPLQYVDNLCQSISSLVLQVQGTLVEKYFSDDEEQKPTLENVTDRQGAAIMGLRKPAYRSRNSTSPTSRARTSSASSENADVKSRETSPTRLKPSSMSPTNSRARASSALSSSEESVEPQKSSRKKYDKATERVGHQAAVGSPKALPNVAAKHVQTFVQEVSWRDNSFYVHGDSPTNQMHQDLDKWTRNKYGKFVDHGNFF